MIRQGGLDEQQSTTRTKVGWSLAAQAVENRPPVMAAIPGGSSSPSASGLGRGDIRWVRDDVVESPPSHGGEEIASEHSHTTSVQQRIGSRSGHGHRVAVDRDDRSGQRRKRQRDHAASRADIEEVALDQWQRRVDEVAGVTTGANTVGGVNRYRSRKCEITARR